MKCMYSITCKVTSGIKGSSHAFSLANDGEKHQNGTHSIPKDPIASSPLLSYVSPSPSSCDSKSMLSLCLTMWHGWFKVVTASGAKLEIVGRTRGRAKEEAEIAAEAHEEGSLIWLGNDSSCVDYAGTWKKSLVPFLRRSGRLRNTPVPLAFDDGKSFLLEFNVIPEQTFAVGEMAREKKGDDKKEPCTFAKWKDMERSKTSTSRPTAVSAPAASRHASAQDETDLFGSFCM